MPKQKRTPQVSVNEGIQGSVTGEVIAVGRHAHASKTLYGGEGQQELLNEIAALRRGLDSLNLTPDARAVVEKDMAKLEAASKKEQPDSQEVGGLLQSIADKLKLVGVIITETITLSGPVGKIAAWAGLSLKALGLL